MIPIKPASAVIGPVIGKRAHEVPMAGVDEYILGYTCFNDVTTRDLQRRDKQGREERNLMPSRQWNLGSSPTRSQAAAKYYAL